MIISRNVIVDRDGEKSSLVSMAEVPRKRLNTKFCADLIEGDPGWQKEVREYEGKESSP